MCYKTSHYQPAGRIVAGRKSKLTPEQWQDVAERLAKGETYRAIAAVYSIDEAAIRKKMKNLRELAERVAVTEISARQNSSELSAMSAPERRIVNSLAASLTEISEHLCHGAKYSAMSFHKLAQMAQLHASKIDDVDPFGPDSAQAARRHAALQELANKSAAVPLALLKANQETIDDLNRASEQPPEPKQIVFTVTDASA